MSTLADQSDEALTLLIRQGNYEALDCLITRHHGFVYNVALRYALNPQDAADLAQEAMVRILTNIGSFANRSTFQTWAYRIVVNTFLNGKRGRIEGQITTFYEYGKALDTLPTGELSNTATADAGLLVQEAKLSCMLGMLLCLNREQRLVFIIGDLFGIAAPTAALFFDVSPPAFRKRLQRARADLHHFMHRKCGLVNKANPCRCRAKTAAFIEAGWVDPHQLKFTRPTLQRLQQQAKRSVPELDELLEGQYRDLYRQHPYYEAPDLIGRLRMMMREEQFLSTFNLDEQE